MKQLLFLLEYFFFNFLLHKLLILGELLPRAYSVCDTYSNPLSGFLWRERSFKTHLALYKEQNLV